MLKPARIPFEAWSSIPASTLQAQVSWLPYVLADDLNNLHAKLVDSLICCCPRFTHACYVSVVKKCAYYMICLQSFCT